MVTKTDSWLEVDRSGLAKILDDRGKAFALLELIQNSADEDGVTTVRVTLEPVDGRNARWNLVVDDDAPAGFHDLSHSYRMFAESKKKGDPTKRGRFNLGEKLVLSICETAQVVSTKGTIVFRADGVREKLAGRTKAGTVFSAVLKMTKPQAEEALEKVRTIIPPSGISIWVNGSLLDERKPVRVLDVKELQTVHADDEGNLKKTWRATTLSLHTPAPGETAMIYEMGIPVVESGDRWHYDVGQKVPLNADRDNVTPSYLRRLRTEVANRTFDLLTEDDTKATWTKEALEDSRIEPEAVKEIITTRFGENAVVNDPSDPEGTKIAMAEGRPIIYGSSLSREAWANVRKANETIRGSGGSGFLLPAGQVTPSPKLFLGADGEPPIPRDQWSDGMVRTARYAEELAREVGVGGIRVAWRRNPTMSNGASCAGAFGGGELTLNLNAVGHEPKPQTLDELLIHEFAHHWSGDHFDQRFLAAACRIGARMASLSREGVLPSREVASMAARAD